VYIPGCRRGQGKMAQTLVESFVSVWFTYRYTKWIVRRTRPASYRPSQVHIREMRFGDVVEKSIPTFLIFLIAVH